MELTVRELAALVGGQFAAEEAASVRISGAAALSDAGQGEVTFFGNAKYLPQLRLSQASAALVPLDFTEAIAPAIIRVENPTLSFSQLLEKFAPAPVRFAPGIHPTAVLGADVVLGAGVSIQPYVVIEDGVHIGDRTLIGAHSCIGQEARIGADCQLAPHVTVGARCTLGRRVIIHSGAVLGSDGFGFELSAGRHVKIPQMGIVQVDDDVEIGANTSIDRARFGRTWIGEGTKIDNLVQIAHNVVVGKHCLIVAQAGISGSTKLGDYVTIAGQVGIVGHIEIGDRAVVAAKSGVSKNLQAGAVVWGSPCQPIQETKEQIVCVRRLPGLFQRVKKVEQILDAAAKSSAKPS